MDETGDAAGRSFQDRRTKFDQALLGLTYQNKVGAMVEIRFGVVCCVRSVDDHNRSRIPRRPRTVPCQVAHRGQAHLGEKVEVVFIDGKYLGLLPPQYLWKSRGGVLQHRVKDGN